jgi:hypothetical protein
MRGPNDAAARRRGALTSPVVKGATSSGAAASTAGEQGPRADEASLSAQSMLPMRRGQHCRHQGQRSGHGAARRRGSSFFLRSEVVLGSSGSEEELAVPWFKGGVSRRIFTSQRGKQSGGAASLWWREAPSLCFNALGSVTSPAVSPHQPRPHHMSAASASSHGPLTVCIEACLWRVQ